jgi:hypothetical protein
MILAPIVTAGMIVHEPAYYSQANVWVARPTNVDPGEMFRSAPYWETPAQTQATVMRDLLGTRSFRAAVAEAAGLGEGGVGRVWKEVGIAATGTNVLAVTATSPNPGDARRLVTAVLAVYEQKATENATETAQKQVDYFTVQLEAASQEMSKRQAAVDAYLAANPGADDPFRPDRTYVSLTGAVDAQRLVVNSYTDSLLGAQTTAASAPQAIAATFSVEDTASSPALIGESVTKRYGYPLVAILIGAAISATYLYVIFRIDHAIRTSHDLVDLPVPVLGFVPQVKGGKPRFLSAAPLRWLWFGNNRDYARHVAASMSANTLVETSK